ncbi:hypothetical protein LEP1GSC151_3194 [Leptospira interrogans serovar Grippotyphosa str. LT2186]|uniref:Uncharacterized protein n=1 Tax=Leptospira interrogans serovar Grippotyphosa str. LT2186 TaxID=1001599 RepID=M3FVJ0_LEPIR|nr:hypothetical protein LEP1GSC151_3194 [Leptospira interrogans serovar Grippotyphosa str. LT2186]
MDFLLQIHIILQSSKVLLSGNFCMSSHNLRKFSKQNRILTQKR